MDVLTLVEAELDLVGLLPPGERVIVGVSGGGDSVCLLDALHSLGVPVVVAHFDHGLRRSRRARYRALAPAAREWSCRTIAVGHTQDDQAETVLMHLLRGSGTRGLRGMSPACRLGEVAGDAQDADLGAPR